MSIRRIQTQKSENNIRQKVLEEEHMLKKHQNKNNNNLIRLKKGGGGFHRRKRWQRLDMKVLCYYYEQRKMSSLDSH